MPRAPKSFRDTYPNASFQVVTPDNYQPFVGIVQERASTTTSGCRLFRWGWFRSDCGKSVILAFRIVYIILAKLPYEDSPIIIRSTSFLAFSKMALPSACKSFACWRRIAVLSTIDFCCSMGKQGIWIFIKSVG